MNNAKPFFIAWNRWSYFPECPTCKNSSSFSMVPLVGSGFYWTGFILFPIWPILPVIPVVLFLVWLIAGSMYQHCTCRKCGQIIVFENSPGHY